MSIKLMTRVWDETKFKGVELILMLAICDHANEDGICWPSHDRLAQKCRCSRRHVVRMIKNLEAEGWLIITRRAKNNFKQSCLYEVNLDPIYGSRESKPFDDPLDFMDVTSDPPVSAM